MSFNLSQRSKDRLKGVHPDLVAVVERAIELTGVDFGVTCGVRTIEEQEANVAAGRSQTMRSKHLPQEDGYSQAVDVVAYVGSDVSWELNLYDDICDAFKAAAEEVGGSDHRDHQGPAVDTPPRGVAQRRPCDLGPNLHGQAQQRGHGDSHRT